MVILYCAYEGRCYWQSKRKTQKGVEYKVCRMIKRWPNEACNQLRVIHTLSQIKKGLNKQLRQPRKLRRLKAHGSHPSF